MKRFVLLMVACLAILLTTFGASLLASSYARAGSASTPRIQMFSGTFNDQLLSVDGVTKITLISIPFSVSTKGKLEASSFIDVFENGAYGYGICELDIDNVAFFSTSTSILPNDQDVSVGVTSATTGIADGNHTLTVK